MVTLLVLDACSHSYRRRCKPRSWEKCLAEDAEVGLLWQSYTMSGRRLSGSHHRGQVADAVIEAHKAAANLVTAVPWDTAQSLLHDLTGMPFGSERLHTLEWGEATLTRLSLGKVGLGGLQRM
jgi:hypothetical protein